MSENEKGVAFVFALVVLLVLVVVGSAIIFLSRHGTKTFVSSSLRDKAFYIANGGIENAIKELKYNSNYTGESNISLGDGVFTVSVSIVGVNRYEIYSTGYVPNATNPTAKRAIKAVVEGVITGIPTQAILTEGKIKIQTDTTVEGDIRANGQIRVEGNLTVNNGSVYTSEITDDSIRISSGKTLTLTSNAYEVRTNGEILGKTRIAGTSNIIENSAPPVEDVELVVIDEDVLLANTVQHPGTTFSGTLDLNNQVHEFPNGVTFASDAIIEGTGTIVASNGERLRFSNSIGSPGNYVKVNIMIVEKTAAAQELEFKGDDYYIEGLIYAPKMTKFDSSNFNHRGIINMYETQGQPPSLWATGDSITITYQELGNIPRGVGSVRMDIISWWEVTE